MCIISITSVSFAAISATDTDITVSGSATSSSGSSCNLVEVEITCGTNTYTQSVPIVAGIWSTTIPTQCLCGDNITILATCTAGGTCFDTVTQIITCPCCPTISISQIVGPCQPGGLRVISFNVSVIIPLQCGPISVQLDFGDGAFDIVHTFNTAGSHVFSAIHAYNPAGSPYTAAINILAPNNCPQYTFSVSVPPCPGSCCPTVSNAHSNNGVCDSNGNIPVTLIANVAPNTGTGCGPMVQVRWDFGDSTQGAIHTVVAPTTIFETHTYNPAGSPYIATLNTITPVGCPPTNLNISIPPCPPPPPPCSTFPWNILCPLVRSLFVVLGIIAATFIIVGLALLIAPVAPIGLLMIGLGVGFAVLAWLCLIFVNMYCVPCNPCQWLLHALGQIFFVTAFTIGLFWGAIPGLIGVSLAVGVFGIGLLIAYSQSCNLNQCGLMREFFNDGIIASIMILLIYFMLIALFPVLVGVIFWGPPLAWAVVWTLLWFIGLITNNC